ncbi:MAG: hypothetical protein OEZ06_12015 [Myxococcales bacterium]|nr:hypothetical protein [Myxococcales bacterium]
MTSPVELLAGALVDRMPGPRYETSLNFAELALRDPLPKVATLRRQRAELGDGFRLALLAPRAAIVGARGPLRFDDGLKAGLEWLQRALDATRATVLVVPTPADLMPGARARDLLESYLQRLPRAEGLMTVWAPRGPWHPEDAAQLAAALGLILAFDPLVDERPPGPAVYARLKALGARRRYAEADFEAIAETVCSEPVSRGYVAVDAERSFEQACRLQPWLFASSEA